MAHEDVDGLQRSFHQMFIDWMGPEMGVWLTRVPAKVYPLLAKVLFIPADTARAIV